MTAAALAVSLLLAVALGSALYADEPQGEPVAAEPMRMDFSHPAIQAAAAGALALLVGGLACLAVLAARAARREPLLAQRPVSPARWTWWDAVKVVAVHQILIILLIAFFGGVEPTGGPGTRIIAWNLVASLGAAAVALRVAVADRGGDWASLGLTLREWPLCLKAGAVGFLAFWPVHLAVSVAGSWAMERFDLHLPEQEAVRLMLRTDDAALLALVGLHALAVAPVVEELFFRAMLIPLLERRMRGWLAVATSAVLFSAVHANLRAALPIFLLGLAMGYVYVRTRSLLAPIVFHVLFNLTTTLGIVAMRASGAG